MSHAQLVESIRSAVLVVSGEMQLGELIDETILVRNGHYCGRRFRTASGSAIWFVEENQIKIYAADGELLRVCSPFAKSLERRAA